MKVPVRSARSKYKVKVTGQSIRLLGVAHFAYACLSHIVTPKYIFLINQISLFHFLTRPIGQPVLSKGAVTFRFSSCCSSQKLIKYQYSLDFKQGMIMVFFEKIECC